MTQTLCSFYRKYEGSPRYGCNGYCVGTKECEPCSCGGIEACCDFYPERREKANKKGKNTMNTAEMWLKAQKDGKMYRSYNLAYSAKTGFIDIMDETSWPVDSVGSINEIFFRDDWEGVKTMTKAEAEKKLGVKIVG